MNRPYRIALASSVLVSTALFAWAWNSSPLNLKDRLFPKHLAEVYPGVLYRSGRIDPALLAGVLTERRIDVIIDLTGPQDRPEQRREIETARSLGVEHHVFRLSGDGTGDIGAYVDAVETIARSVEAKRTVLVHCSAGDRRTGGVVAAYQLLLRGESLERAASEIQRFARTPIGESKTWPFLRKHLSDIAHALHGRGIDDAMRPELARRLWERDAPSAGIGDG